MSTLANVAKNALKPDYLPEMSRKVLERIRYGTRQAASGQQWASERGQDLDAWARAIDAELWKESLAVAERMKSVGGKRMSELSENGVTMGGGGCYELLFFLTRLRRPDAVVETGVSTGWSSWAILEALQKNDSGRLMSSDFPYFRIKDPEQYIGYVVPENEQLRSRWKLWLKGDRKNLKEILSPGLTVDLFHYDSDKSRGGREFFGRAIASHLNPKTVVVMDDIGDDMFFAEYSQSKPYVVFTYGTKHVGVVGLA